VAVRTVAAMARGTVAKMALKEAWDRAVRNEVRCFRAVVKEGLRRCDAVSVEARFCAPQMPSRCSFLADAARFRVLIGIWNTYALLYFSC
jgi:hypothetical protein